ncbi:hypothetical protein G6011_00966 [Alternaria panax]|nr:hypothetical protein G6011_08019 [Alternaria panax]KAG9189382.1 hypothetical protein G6011_06250 [Alternaria panax]KAG9191200.1 hypothetical protein G6011_09288 [Alternaria panax]KAG9191571.1 hypothetical protein G6011_10305 [Alternaria panax]KAG9192991.1 hypothetical protein G6011_11725 [Alternaria panax]
MVRLPGSPYQGQNSPRLALSRDPEDSKWRDLDRRMLALAPQSLPLPGEAERPRPQHEEAPGASRAFQPQPSPTLPQSQTSYTQLSPKYSPHTAQRQCPRNNEDSSPHTACNEKSSRSLAGGYGQHEPGAVESNSGYGRVEKSEPWAWSGEVRKGKKRGYDTTGTPKPPPPPPD